MRLHLQTYCPWGHGTHSSSFDHFMPLETGKGLRKGPVRPFSQALSPGLFPKLRNFPESCPEIKPELALEVTQKHRKSLPRVSPEYAVTAYRVICWDLYRVPRKPDAVDTAFCKISVLFFRVLRNRSKECKHLKIDRNRLKKSRP